MDGQMFGAGNTSLGQIAQKLRAGKIGGGATPEQKKGDAFWAALNDMHPDSSRTERIRGAAAQQAGFDRVRQRAQAAVAGLPAPEARLLEDNLVFQSAIMVQTSTWLVQVETAHEALELGRMADAVAALTAAEAAFAQIPRLAEGYARDPWENWYRGSKKLNIAATLQRTRDVLLQAGRTPR
jgi:hypothetical protein